MKNLINGVIAHFAGAKARRSTLMELRCLTDRDLNDIGITRWDVTAIGDDVYETVRTKRLAEMGALKGASLRTGAVSA